MQRKLILSFVLVSLLSFSYFAYPDHPADSNITFPKDQIERDLALIKRQTIYNFDIVFLPDEVEVKAGENATIDITVVNRGSYALREFNLSLSGIDYPYEITPNVKEIPVWGEWSSTYGLTRAQQNYRITIMVPPNATDVYLVNLTGRENFSWRKFSKSQVFILKVIPLIPIEPNITVSRIKVPETVKENVPFDMKFSVSNLNVFRQRIDISIDMPEGWSANKTKQSLLFEANETLYTIFTLTPTNTSGNISVNVEYPFKKNIFSITREGPLLIPVTEEKPKVEPEPVKRKTGFAALVDYLRNLSPIFIAIMVLITVIVIWFIVKLIRFYSSRKKPETMKKRNEIDAIGLE